MRQGASAASATAANADSQVLEANSPSTGQVSSKSWWSVRMTLPRMAGLLPQAPVPGPTHWHARIGRQKRGFRCALQALQESPRHRQIPTTQTTCPASCQLASRSMYSTTTRPNIPPLPRHRGRRVLLSPPPRGRKNFRPPIGTRSWRNHRRSLQHPCRVLVQQCMYELHVGSLFLFFFVNDCS